MIERHAVFAMADHEPCGILELSRIPQMAQCVIHDPWLRVYVLKKEDFILTVDFVRGAKAGADQSQAARSEEHTV